MPSIAIVIPVYNNCETIEELTERLVVSIGELTSNFRIIFVEDGSSDSSWSKIQSVSRQVKNVTGIKLARNFGQHAAIQAGLESADTDYVGIMDADLQEIPENWPILLKPLINGECDICIGTIERRVRLTSRVFHAVSAGHFGGIAPVTQRCFNKKVNQAILSYRTVNVVYGPELENIGFKKLYVGVSKRNTVSGGKSSYSFYSRLNLALDYIGYRTLKHVAFLAFSVSILSGAFALYGFIVAMSRIFYGNEFAPGISLIQFTVMLGFSATMLVTSATAMIVSRINSEFTGSPRYIVQEKSDDFNM